MARPPRVLAFLMTLLAGAALAVPVLYSIAHYSNLGAPGRLLALLVVAVAIFGILTVLVSVVKAFLAPAVQDLNGRRKNGNL